MAKHHDDACHFGLAREHSRGQGDEGAAIRNPEQKTAPAEIRDAAV